MKEIIQENKVWFISFLFFILIGGGLLLNIKTSDAIYFFSENRSEFGDLFFKYFTKVGEEYIYVLLFIVFLFYRIRYSILVGVTGFFVTIISFGLKTFFAHDRPLIFFQKLKTLDTLNLVDGVQMYTGQSSFPSGHTMSGFAIFGLLAFILPKKGWIGFLLFIIAFLIGLSRVYLVQHFFKDIYLGAILGVLIALVIFWIQKKYSYRPNSILDGHLGVIKAQKTRV